MRSATVFLVVVAAPTLGWATTPIPFSGYCTLSGRIASLITSGSAEGPAALEVLEQITVGKAADVSADLEKQVGLESNRLSPTSLRS